MTITLIRPAVLFSALVLCAPPARSEDTNVLTGAERADGWRLLFDGVSLSGWRGLASPNPGAGWKVIYGAIVRTAKSGDLVTAGEFGDFELSIDWKVERAANSGILYRVSLAGKEAFHTGPEYQILDVTGAKDLVDPKHETGALYDLVAPPRDLARPVGAWNHALIVVRGWHIEHWLNGEKIVDADLGSAEGRDLIAHSKFRAWPPFATFARGHIALQDHDNSVSFRNIKIRETPGVR